MNMHMKMKKKQNNYNNSEVWFDSFLWPFMSYSRLGMYRCRYISMCLVPGNYQMLHKSGMLGIKLQIKRELRENDVAKIY